VNTAPDNDAQPKLATDIIEPATDSQREPSTGTENRAES